MNYQFNQFYIFGYINSWLFQFWLFTNMIKLLAILFITNYYHLVFPEYIYYMYMAGDSSFYRGMLNFMEAIHTIKINYDFEGQLSEGKFKELLTFLIDKVSGYLKRVNLAWV